MPSERSITKRSVRGRIIRITKDLMKSKRLTRSGIATEFIRFVRPYELPRHEQELIEQFSFEVLKDVERRLRVFRLVLEEDVFYRGNNGNKANGSKR
jgi:hypothetical protein